eukprot:4138559-Pyramimonas_sp.AAC.1
MPELLPSGSQAFSRKRQGELAVNARRQMRRRKNLDQSTKDVTPLTAPRGLSVYREIWRGICAWYTLRRPMG